MTDTVSASESMANGKRSIKREVRKGQVSSRLESNTVEARYPDPKTFSGNRLREMCEVVWNDRQIGSTSKRAAWRLERYVKGSPTIVLRCFDPRRYR